MNPVNAADSSYAQAGADLSRRGFEVVSHQGGPLNTEILDAGDVLVIAHPADQGSERATGSGSPIFTVDELDAVETFVRAGGGLVVLGECVQDRYGSNLTELLARFGVGIRSTTVHEGERHHNGVATWVLPTELGPQPGQGLLAGVGQACFYRAGVLDLGATDARVLARTSAAADPAGAPVAASLQVDRGRLVVFADSDLGGPRRARTRPRGARRPRP